MSCEKTFLLVENLRGTSESVARESSFRFANVFSHFQIRVDATLLDYLHFLNIKDYQIMAVLIFSILIDKRNELNHSLHVIKCLEGKIDIVIMLWLFLEINQFLEGHISREVLQNIFLGSLECVTNNDSNRLFHLDQRLMIILSHFLYFFDRLLHHKIVVLTVKLLLFVDKSEDKDVTGLTSEVHNGLDIFSIVV